MVSEKGKYDFINTNRRRWQIMRPFGLRLGNDEVRAARLNMGVPETEWSYFPEEDNSWRMRRDSWKAEIEDEILRRIIIPREASVIVCKTLGKNIREHKRGVRI